MLEIIDLHTGATLSGCNSSVICLGNFDGVHRGHAELIRQTVELKKKLAGKHSGILGGAWCFRQPPAEFLFGKEHLCLTTTDEKLKLFAELGLDIAVLGDFPSMRNMTPQFFAKEILTKSLGCRAAVCGFNFKFGKNGAGTPMMLNEYIGEDCITVEPVMLYGDVVSSSRIRELLSNGDAEEAERLLGHPYSAELKVVKGKMLGREWGIPTLNQFFTKEKFVPAIGVYASTVSLNGKEYISVSNVGTNPTVGDVGVRCETHILDFSGNLYGETVKVSFRKFLRGEQKFSDVEALKAAIFENIRETREYFKDKNI